MHKRTTWINSLILALLCLLATSSVLATTSQLIGLQINSDAQGTRLEFNLTSSVNYHVFTLPNPDRLVIDLSGTQLGTSLHPLNLTNTPFSQVREGHPTPNVLRLVFNLNQALPAHGLSISQTTQHGEQLFINLSPNPNNKNNVNTPTSVSTPTATSALQQTQQWAQENVAQTNNNQQNKTINNPIPSKQNISTTSANTGSTNTASSNTTTTSNTTANTVSAPVAPPTTLTDANNTPQYNNLRRPIVIVIDPGHGGKDPGTISPNGIREKDVVLAISRDLFQLLQKEPGYRSALTRTNDYFIPLRGRLAIARQDKGDMFIAIHADAAGESDATGAAVFALSPHGASSEAARWLAEKENYSELGAVPLSDKSDMLRSVLIDLSQTATISSSLQLGSALLPQLAKVGRLHYTHVETAPFMVLKSPDIPSLLVETGFLSNPLEERRLSDPRYQQEIAQALFTGIKNYFWNNPPPGTLIAALKQNSKRTV